MIAEQMIIAFLSGVPLFRAYFMRTRAVASCALIGDLVYELCCNIKTFKYNIIMHNKAEMCLREYNYFGKLYENLWEKQQRALMRNCAVNKNHLYIYGYAQHFGCHWKLRLIYIDIEIYRAEILTTWLRDIRRIAKFAKRFILWPCLTILLSHWPSSRPRPALMILACEPGSLIRLF